MAHTPIVVGVGDYVNRSLQVADAHEPLQLMLKAIENALNDTQLSVAKRAELQSAIDSIEVVQTWTWPYDDLPGDIGQRLRVNAPHRHYSPHGGNQPGKLFDGAARRISQGQTKVAVVTGGEALASLNACMAAKQMPPPGWTKTKHDGKGPAFSTSDRVLKKDPGGTHSITAPILIYPLFENGFRAHRAQSIADNHDESAEMYAEFAKVAEQNQYAWSYGSPTKTKHDIGTVTKRNRMIGFPYPLLMNAFNTINLAGACILTSTAFAAELGIPQSQWIYVLGGAGTQDSDNFWERPNYYSSPAIERSIDTCLKVSGLSKDDIDLFDFYSCFPVVPKIAATHLNLPVTNGAKPITLLGGLTSFGGAGNNYSMHALTEMTRQLRQGKGRHGLVLANGGYMTYQHAICLSNMRRPSGLPYPDQDPLPQYVTDVPVPRIVEAVEEESDAVIESYTLDYSRDNKPMRAYIVGRLKSNDHRFVANHADPHTLERLASFTGEKIGLAGRVRSDGVKNLFSLPQDLVWKL